MWPIDGILREGSSLITPTISFEFASDFSPMSNSFNLQFNYAYVDKFARYYWITDWTYDGGLWHASMKVDVLATFRPEILAADAFVAYDETPNTDIVDQRLSMLTAKRINSASDDFLKLGRNESGGGAIILLVTGQDSTAAFALTAADITNIMNNVIDFWEAELAMPEYPGDPDTDPFAIVILKGLLLFAATINQEVTNLFSNGNAAENLRAAVQLPIDILDITGTRQRIFLGQYDTVTYGKRIDNRVFYDQCEITIPWQYADWRNNEPYTEIFLYIPFVGNVKMPNNILIGETSLRVKAMVDLMSGDAIFKVFIEPSDKLISMYTVNIGAGYPIGASMVAAGQTVTGLAGAAGAIAAAAATGGAGAIVAGSLGAISGVMAANTPQSSCVGGGGGGAAQGAGSRCTITVVTHDLNVIPGTVLANSVMGSPTMLVKSLGNLTGYVQTIGAAITGNMTATEHAELNALLDGGIYIETGG